jgi:hypothetical protein
MDAKEKHSVSCVIKQKPHGVALVKAIVGSNANEPLGELGAVPLAKKTARNEATGSCRM